jgi:hypothetical protein
MLSCMQLCFFSLHDVTASILRRVRHVIAVTISYCMLAAAAAAAAAATAAAAAIVLAASVNQQT